MMLQGKERGRDKPRKERQEQHRERTSRGRIARRRGRNVSNGFCFRADGSSLIPAHELWCMSVTPCPSPRCNTSTAQHSSTLHKARTQAAAAASLNGASQRPSAASIMPLPVTKWSSLWVSHSRWCSSRSNLPTSTLHTFPHSILDLRAIPF